MDRIQLRHAPQAWIDGIWSRIGLQKSKRRHVPGHVPLFIHHPAIRQRTHKTAARILKRLSVGKRQLIQYCLIELGRRLGGRLGRFGLSDHREQ